MKNLLLIIFVFLTSLAYGQFQPAQRQYLDKGNLLSNPGFENGKFRGWVYGGTGSCALSTTAIAGDQSILCTMTAQTIQMYQDVTNYMSLLAGSQGVLRFSAINTAANATVCVRYNSVIQSGENNCVTLATDGVKKNYELPIIFNGTSTGLEFSATSTTGTTRLDNFGLADDLSMPEVSQMIQENILLAVGTTRGGTITSVVSTKTSGTESQLFSYTSDGTNGTTLTALKDIMMDVSISVGYANTINATGSITVNGTAVAFWEMDSSGSVDNRDGTSANIKLASGDVVRFLSDTNTAGGGYITAIAKYNIPASKVYSVNDNNGETTFTGSGSWVTNTTYSKATYKFLPDGWVEYQYAWSTSGAPTSATLTLNLPSGHTIDTTRLAQGNVSGMLISSGFLNDSSTNFYQVRANFVASALTSVGVTPFGAAATYATANNSVTQAIPFTWGAGDTGQIIFRLPITVWKGSQITGTFKEVMTVKNVSKPILASASIDASEVITENESSFITSCTNADPSVCTVTTSFFSSDPKCWAEPTSAGTVATVTADTTTSITIDRTDASTPFKLFCHGATQ